MALRDYQSAALAAAVEGRKAAINKQLFVLATGAGKMIIAANMPGVLGLRKQLVFLAHRNQLCDQAARQFQKFNPTLRVSIDRAFHKADFNADIIVASVPTVGKLNERDPDLFSERLKLYNRDTVEMVLIDECLVAGTEVDGVPIEFLRVGDLIESFNHSTKRTNLRKVSKISKRIPEALVLIVFRSGRSLVCTPSHPIFDYPSGKYVPAGRIGYGNMVLTTTYDNPRMRALQNSSSGQTLHEMLPIINGGAQQAGCSGTNATTQPDERPSGEGETEDHPQGDGLEAASARGERKTDSGTATSAITRPGVADRACSKNRDGAPSLSIPLQDRHSQPGTEDRNRSRRHEPSVPGPEEARFGEAGFLGVDWVESVTLLKPGSDGRFGGMCPDGYVYNLEVEGDHNYFANGILVHNCHHIPGNEMFLQPLRYFRVYKAEPENCDPTKYLAGFTATPGRTDGVGLETVFDKIVFSRDLRELIEAGWLADPAGYRVETFTELDQIRFTHGDFATHELERAVNTPERNELIVKKYRELAGGKSAIAFTVDVAHSHDLAVEFRRNGISALPMSGSTPEEERARILHSHRDGETTVITSCGVLNEGADLPWAYAGLMCRPTASGLLYRQQVGRLTRLYPAPEEGEPIKTSCLIIDFADVSIRHRLLTVPTLFGLPPELDLQGSRAVAAIAEVEETASQLKLPAFRSLAELRSIVEQINLFPAPTISDTVRAFSRFTWIESSPDNYRLVVPAGPILSIRQNALGLYSLSSLDNGRRIVILDNVDTLRTAFQRADQMVPVDARRLLAIDAGWRGERPTDKQIWRLAQVAPDMFSVYGRDMRKFTEFIMSTCTKGQVSDRIRERTGT